VEFNANQGQDTTFLWEQGSGLLTVNSDAEKQWADKWPDVSTEVLLNSEVQSK
jgi:hypothetical protein